MPVCKIRIANFKSFEDQTVELNGFNLLVGANASGKSNFVQAFKFLRDIATHGLEDAISLQGGVEYVRNLSVSDTKPLIFDIIVRDLYFLATWNNSIQLRRELDLDMINAFRYEFSLNFHDEGAGFSVGKDKMTLSCSPGLSDSAEGKVRDRKRLILENVDGRMKVDQRFREVEFLSSVDNQPIPATESLLTFPFSRSVMGSALYLFNEIGIYDFDPRLAKSAIPIAGRSQLEMDASNLALVLNRLLHDKDTKRNFLNLCRRNLPFIHRLGIGKLTENSMFIKLRETFEEDKEIPAFLISDGTVNILALVVALYFQDHKKFAIFEEPERHIHPYLISRVLSMFKEASREKQILATTHSPEVVKHAGLDSILLVSRGGNGASCITRPADSEHVRIFLRNNLGVEDLFADNLLGV